MSDKVPNFQNQKGKERKIKTSHHVDTSTEKHRDTYIVLLYIILSVINNKALPIMVFCHLAPCSQKLKTASPSLKCMFR